MNILMLEDNPADVRLIYELLKNVGGARYHFEQAGWLAQGVERLRTNNIDIVLLDLGLKDSQGMDTLLSVSRMATNLPVIIMTGLDDELTAVKALQQGAQDYLIKGQVDGPTLWRSLRYAVERKRVQCQNDLSLKVLEVLNKPGEQKEIVRELLLLIKEFTGAAAVGMRLKEGNDYPYYETDGFVPGHVEAENFLGQKDGSGTPVLDSKGRPVLECLCGKVIDGRFDPELTWFTKGGSFWTNSMADLRATHSMKDRRAHLRTRCGLEGYESVALIPLRAQAGNMGLLHLCDQNRGHFTAEFIEFIEGVAQSIGAVLARQRAEHDLQISYGSLQRSLRKTIDTIARIVEMRDPYTSGHQQRVAALAKTIAAEMKLDDSQIDQVWMAATIHDVGKMLVPVDILSRPGVLSSLEWQIIKTHPQSGYEILKEMEFPFPMATAILQHHERLNGSGYPDGLKDGDIILTARIIAVADVVEAMASHRPYRPALGMEMAISEITDYSGILYDAEVVSACRKLFLEKGYAFDKIPVFPVGPNQREKADRR